MLGTPELDAALQGGLSRAEQRGRIPSLDLLLTLLDTQPRTRVAFWAASTRCWLMWSFSSPSTPKSFPSGLFSVQKQLGMGDKVFLFPRTPWVSYLQYCK